MKTINLKERNRRALGIPNRNVSHSLIIDKHNHYHKNLFEYRTYNPNAFDLNEWKQKLALKSCNSSEYFNKNCQSKLRMKNSQCEDYINKYLIQNPKFSQMKEIFYKKNYNLKLTNNIISDRSVKGNHEIRISQTISRKNTDHSSNKLCKSAMIDKNEIKRIFKLDEFKKPLIINLFLDNIKLRDGNSSLNTKISKGKSKSEPEFRLFKNTQIQTSNSQQNNNGIKLALDLYRTTGTLVRRIKVNK